MAQPKRRWSKARTGLKRSTWKLEKQNLVACPHCHEMIMQHRVFLFLWEIFLTSSLKLK